MDDIQLKALRRGRDNELKLNEAAMKVRIYNRTWNTSYFYVFTQKRFGQPVCFNDMIQLQHVTSMKFVTVQSSEVAVMEPENLKVYLDAVGSTESHLCLFAKLRIDEEVPY